MTECEEIAVAMYAMGHGPRTMAAALVVVRAEMEGESATITAEVAAALLALGVRPLAALKRAAPWLGKMIADGGHLRAVAPLDAENTLAQIEALIKES